MRYAVVLLGLSTVLALAALAGGPSDPAPLPRLEVYESGTTARPWRVRLVAANGDVLFTHASTFGTEVSARERAEAIRATMGSAVEIRYPSWVAPPDPDPLAVRAFNEATAPTVTLDALRARFGAPTSMARWGRIPDTTPWEEGESRMVSWHDEATGLRYAVEVDEAGAILSRALSWETLPSGSVPWTR